MKACSSSATITSEPQLGMKAKIGAVKKIAQVLILIKCRKSKAPGWMACMSSEETLTARDQPVVILNEKKEGHYHMAGRHLHLKRR